MCRISNLSETRTLGCAFVEFLSLPPSPAALPHLSKVAPPSLALLFLPHLRQLPQSSVPVMLSDLHSTNGGNLQLQLSGNHAEQLLLMLLLANSPPNPTVKNISLHVDPIHLSQLLPMISAQPLMVPFHYY